MCFFYFVVCTCVFDEQVEETLGPIDVLVNNAGVAVQSPSLKQTKREWEKVQHRPERGWKKKRTKFSLIFLSARTVRTPSTRRRPRGQGASEHNADHEAI